jgi:hypothetical protein
MNRKSLPGAEHNSAKKKNSGAFEITPAHQLARRFITRVHHMLPGPGNSSSTAPENEKGV